MAFGFGGEKVKQEPVSNSATQSLGATPERPVDTAALAARSSAPPALSGVSTRSKPAQLAGYKLQVSAEFVKSLEIDPVKECEMLWIAEEAFQAQLPPAWEEHIDEHGCVYFYNIATSQSYWQHPMDDLFKELGECWRRVQNNGGFWEAEDELKLIEDKIRQECNDEWMEMYDDKAQKFFHNRQTEESRMDDPRLRLYHDLHARITMVGKMKEKAPILAQAPRPEGLLIGEELQRLQDEEKERCLVKCRQEEQPFEFTLVNTDNEKMREVIPWTWQLAMHPVDEGGHVCEHPHQTIDLFAEVGLAAWNHAAGEIQRCAVMGQRHQRMNDEAFASDGDGPKDQAATRIQACCRGRAARCQFEVMKEERLWPMKGWFEYNGTGLDAVRVEVLFLPNPRFNESQYFHAYGMPSGRTESEQDGNKQRRADMEEARSPSKDEETRLQQDEKRRRASGGSQQELKAQETAPGKEVERSAKLMEETGVQSEAISAQAVAVQEESLGFEAQAMPAGSTAGLDGSGIADPINKEEECKVELTEGAQVEGQAKSLDHGESALVECEYLLAEGDAWAMAAKLSLQPLEHSGSPSNSYEDRPESRHKASPSHKNLGDGYEFMYEPDLSRIPSHASCDDAGRIGSKASRGSGRMQEGLEATRDKNNAMGETVSHFGGGSQPAIATGTRKHYAGVYKDGLFIRTMKNRLEDLSEKEKAQVMADITEERKRKVEILVQRQKKHESKRRRQQAREAKNMGQTRSTDNRLDDEQKEKVRQLKRWLKKKEEAEDTEQQEPGSTGKLEQEHMEMRERRDRIAEQRRTAMAMTMCALDTPHRMLHRHVHHHVHYHDGSRGASSDEEEMPTRQSFSAGVMRGYVPGQPPKVDKMGFARSVGSNGKLPPAGTWPAQPFKGGSAPLLQQSCSMPALGVRRT